VGDQVMAAVELRPGATFDPDGFARWLADQPDLGTKWAPRFVRLSTELPQTATGKVTKVGLRSEGWDCTEEVWWRPDGATGYRPLTEDDRAALAAELAAVRAERA
jgi:fatty-acyl-CoA synthase